MKLIIDCALSHPLLALPADSALSGLLAIADIRTLEMPLEAVISEQFGLRAATDYPLAAIAASADGLEVGEAYWLRADPVHLLLQRDSFSLSEPVPLKVELAQARIMIADLNRHFSADGMQFMLGNSGAWYLRLDKPPQIKTSLPSVALDRNIYRFMPEGADASKWLSYINEIQMLLHDHSVNQTRESARQPAINSLWFSGGGVMPPQLQNKKARSAVVASNPLYQGLARISGVDSLPSNMPWSDLYAQPYEAVRLAISPEHTADDTLFKDLQYALNGKKVSQLIINLGCFDRTIVLSLKPYARFKFWRKRKPINAYL